MGRAPQPAQPAMRFTREPSPEVLAYFRYKGLHLGFDWRDTWPEQHAHSFTVAKAMRMDVLTAIREEVDRAIAEGLPFEAFAASLTPRLQRLGWWGREEMIDPATGEAILAQLGSPHRLRIIYDANIRTANAAGQWARIVRTAAVLPFLQYQHTTSQEPREEHWAWAEQPVVLRWDDPWWNTHFPPNGWQCKCWVLQIDEEEARAEGWTPGTRAPENELVPWYNARTGETTMIPEGIDPGWQTNPGKTRASLLDALLNNKLEEVEPAIRAAVLKDLASGWLFRQIAEGKISDRPNEPKKRPALMPEVVDAWVGLRGARAQVAAPAGHLAEAIQQQQGWKSGIVWLDPEGAAEVRRQAGRAGIDWTLLPRVLDEGAIVRHDATRNWLTIYRRIDGQWYAAEVMLRESASDGVTLEAGPRLRLESFRRVDARTAKFALIGAGKDVLRPLAPDDANLYEMTPLPPGTARPRLPGQAPPEGTERPRLPDEAPPDGTLRPRLPGEAPSRIPGEAVPVGAPRPRLPGDPPPGTVRPRRRKSDDE